MSPTTRVRLRVLRVGSTRAFEALAVRGGAWRTLEFPALVGLLEHPTRGPFLFDTGYSTAFFGATRGLPGCLYRWATPVELRDEQRLEVQLARLGLRTADIQGLFLSHFHADHVAGLGAFPGRRVWTSNSAFEAVRRLGSWSGLRRAHLPALLPDDLGARLVPIEAAARRRLDGPWAALGEGHDVFGDGSLLVVLLPGHARGQFGLLVREETGLELLLAADAVWTTRALREKRLPAAPARLLVDDWAAYGHTLAALGGIASRDDLRILPSHCLEAWRALPSALRFES
jgi:glyoxylase-like metal-dependent hydrolase (beta-lactamase superfamily II)